MFGAIFKRIKKDGLVTVGAIIFALIMTFSLCGLSAASEHEIVKYEEAYRTIKVTMKVTSLTGMRDDGLELPKWVINAFSDWPMGSLIKDVQVKLRAHPESMTADEVPTGCGDLIGMDSPELDRDLLRHPDAITYFENYDESVWTEENFAVIIPESMLNGNGEAPNIKMTFSYDDPFDSWPGVTESFDFIVVGTHSLDRNDIFASYQTVLRVHKTVGMPIYADSVRATVANNDHLEGVRAGMKKWFTEPSLTAERVPWRYSYYFYYPYALEIDDSQLIRAGEIMRTNIKINEISTVAVFVLSAGAGFLVGFLMINRRKKEIMLMRTLGCPDVRIFAQLLAEQFLFCLVGAALGGAAFLWSPVERILIFVGVYSVGLAISLIVFLRKNLLTSIKEE